METLRALAAVSWIAVELRLRGFAASCSRYLTEPPDTGKLDGGVAEKRARAYGRTSRLPWSSCLTRSIALCRRLRRCGMPAVLRIGANLDADGFRAHAWVELAGRVINDRSAVARDFSAFARNRP